MKRKILILAICLLGIAGCSGSEEEAQNAEQLCAGHRGVRALSTTKSGYISFVTCNDNTVHGIE